MKNKLSIALAKGIAKTNFFFNCKSCGVTMHMQKSCNGLTNTAKAGLLEVSQIVFPIHNSCSNNKRNLVINIISFQTSASKDKWEAINETLEYFQQELESIEKHLENMKSLLLMTWSLTLAELPRAGENSNPHRSKRKVQKTKDFGKHGF